MVIGPNESAHYSMYQLLSPLVACPLNPSFPGVGTTTSSSLILNLDDNGVNYPGATLAAAFCKVCVENLGECLKRARAGSSSLECVHPRHGQLHSRCWFNPPRVNAKLNGRAAPACMSTDFERDLCATRVECVALKFPSGS